MPQFCSLFYAILQSWRPKEGGHGPMAPLNTPLGTSHAKRRKSPNYILTEVFNIYLSTYQGQLVIQQYFGCAYCTNSVRIAS